MKRTSRVNSFLSPVEGVRGGAARQGLRINRVDPPQGLYCSIQLGGNDSAWQFRLGVPKMLRPEYVMRVLEAQLDRRTKPKPREAPRLPPTQVASTPPAEPATIVSAALDDLETLALALAPLFPLRSTQTMFARVVSKLCAEFSWDEPIATQIVKALANRKQFELRGTGDLEIVRVVVESRLASHLVTLDALKTPVTTSITDATKPEKAKPPTRVSRSTAKTVSPEPPKAVQLVPDEFRPPNPPAPVDTSFPAVLTVLTQRANAFEEAQAFLRVSDSAHGALRARLDRARAEADKAEAELRELDQKRSDATRIVTDSEYSQAGSKIQKIRAIIEDS